MVWHPFLMWGSLVGSSAENTTMEVLSCILLGM